MLDLPLLDLRKKDLTGNETSRMKTFMERKKEVLKRFNEVMKLEVEAGGPIIMGPCEPFPEALPSREGVQEVASKLTELSLETQTKEMVVNQESSTSRRITKATEQLLKVCEENGDPHSRDLMFRCLQREMEEHPFDESDIRDDSDIRDLNVFIDKYLCEVTRRLELRAENGGSSSLPPPPPPFVVDADADEDAADALIGLDDQVHKEPFQFDYQALYDFYEQIPKKLHAMNMEYNLNLDWRSVLCDEDDEDLDLDPNPNPEEKQSFTDLLKAQMGDAGEHTYTSSMDLLKAQTGDAGELKYTSCMDLLKAQMGDAGKYTSCTDLLKSQMGDAGEQTYTSWTDLLSAQMGDAGEHTYTSCTDLLKAQMGDAGEQTNVSSMDLRKALGDAGEYTYMPCMAWLKAQIGDVGEHTNVSSMDGTASTPDPATTSLMDLMRAHMRNIVVGEDRYISYMDGMDIQASTSNPVVTSTGFMSSVTTVSADVCAPDTTDIP